MNKVKQNSLLLVQRIPASSGIKKTFLLQALVYYFFSAVTFANPTGGHISDGSGTITTSNGKHIIIQQNTDKMVIDWHSFNLAASDKTEFIQPSTHAIVLNRIDPANGSSVIAGHLTANGNVWLLNPAGIAFAKGAKVDTAGLLATTAEITNANFMSGNYQFTHSAAWHGVIQNDGTITIANEGIAALVAPNVANNGVIQAKLGKVVLAAANEFTLDFYGDQLIVFGVNSAVDKTDNKNIVSNNGKITANGGTVLLTAKAASNVLDDAISMDGYIIAKSASSKDGTIILSGNDSVSIHVTGQLTTSKNGTIKIEHELVVPPVVTPAPVPVETPTPVVEVTPIPIVEVAPTPIVAETPIITPQLINNTQPIATVPSLTLTEQIAAPVIFSPTTNLTSVSLPSAHESESKNLAYLTNNAMMNQLIAANMRSSIFNSANIFVMNNPASNMINNNAIQIDAEASHLSLLPEKNTQLGTVNDENNINSPIAENSLQLINDVNSAPSLTETNNQQDTGTTKKQKQSI